MSLDRSPRFHTVLVHGAWHGPWCWEPVAPHLERLGAHVTAVQLPSCTPALGGLAADAEAVTSAVAALPGDLPIIVVGHSYGGVVATQAELAGHVARIVYLAAFVPDVGMSLVAHFDAIPPYAQVGRERVDLVHDLVVDTFYQDCDPAEAARWAGRLVPHAAAAVTTPVTHASWRAVPSTYVVCTEDRVVPVDIQRLFAARATTVVDLPASHTPMLSRPAEVAALIARAVA